MQQSSEPEQLRNKPETPPCRGTSTWISYGAVAALLQV